MIRAILHAAETVPAFGAAPAPTPSAKSSPTLDELDAMVAAEIARLEATNQTPPFGGWRNRAVEHVAAKLDTNPYRVDRDLRSR